MSFQDNKANDRRRRADDEQDQILTESNNRSEPRNSKRSLPASDVGNALKTVYQRAVSEDIPPEMLDLLGKLG